MKYVLPENPISVFQLQNLNIYFNVFCSYLWHILESENCLKINHPPIFLGNCILFKKKLSVHYLCL